MIEVTIDVRGGIAILLHPTTPTHVGTPVCDHSLRYAAKHSPKIGGMAMAKDVAFHSARVLIITLAAGAIWLQGTS
jgi:hypothetical protein